MKSGVSTAASASAEGALLRVGDHIPHFAVRTLDGTPIEYSSIWQRRFLLLVLLPADSSEFEELAGKIMARASDWSAQETACVITRDPVPGLPSPGVVIADRWGEIEFLMPIDKPADAPAPDEILDSVSYVRMQCPECQGETR